MMYSYMTLADGAEVVHSQLIEDGDGGRVLVHFERPMQDGFDSARCELPSYTWTTWECAFFREEILTSRSRAGMRTAS